MTRYLIMDRNGDFHGVIGPPADNASEALVEVMTMATIAIAIADGADPAAVVLKNRYGHAGRVDVGPLVSLPHRLEEAVEIIGARSTSQADLMIRALDRYIAELASGVDDTPTAIANEIAAAKIYRAMLAKERS